MRKVILRFKVVSNLPYAKFGQRFVDPDSQMPTNFLREEKCHWSAIGNRCNSPTKKALFSKEIWQKTAQFSLYMNDGFDKDCCSEL